VVDGQRWDTGVEVRLGRGPIQLATAVTQGTLSYPRARDDNDGKQVSARLQATPIIGFVAGISAAAGRHSDRGLDAALPPDESGRVRRQRAVGLDLEYARGHVTIRAEGIWTEWDLPAIDAPRIEDPVDARALSVEAVYRLAPGLDVAGRFDRLGFGDIQGSAVRDSWDAPVTRVEAGVVYALRRGLRLKAVYQHNWREAGPRGRRGFPAAQVVWQF
jgi:predicted porin